MMTITVHKEDFKDFKGLQQAAHLFKDNITKRRKKFYIYKIHDDGWNNPYEYCKRFKGDAYNIVLKFLKKEFDKEDQRYVKSQMDNLNGSAEDWESLIFSKLCYEKGTYNRKININHLRS